MLVIVSRVCRSYEGHQKVVGGIALPSGSDKLYTGSKDETLRIWDLLPLGRWNLRFWVEI